MADTLIVNGEAAYLLLLARRIHNFAKAAEARGEEYHDLAGYTELQCGLSAKMRFEKKPDGTFLPVIYLRPSAVDRRKEDTPAVRRLVATEILGRAAYFHGAVGDDERFHTENPDFK